MDTSWSTLTKPWERVRWARLYWQQRVGMEPTARAAAAALGMQENTYTLYERPYRSNKDELEVRYARKFGRQFKVSWQWLSVGDPYSPFDEELSPETQSLARDLEQLPEDQRKAKVEAIRALLTGTNG